MKNIPASIFAFSAFLITGSALAADVPVPEFSQGEIASNRQNAKLISETAAACLQRTWDTHVRFYKQRGYSKFYGVRREDYKNPALRKEALLKILPELAKRVRTGDREAIKELDRREKELETTACVDLARKCLKEGFGVAGMEETWAKIDRWVRRPGADGKPLVFGTDIQKALINLGWKSLYWNPDTSLNGIWDSAEMAAYPPKGESVTRFKPNGSPEKWNPVWGGHSARFSTVKNNRAYYGIPIQDISTLVNFGTEEPAEFAAVPFFLGTAHSGYHVFPGFNGKVIEAHSMRNLKGFDNMEIGPFNPLNQKLNGVANGDGSPKWTNSEHYRSGVMVVPPGMIADKPFAVPPVPMDSPNDGPDVRAYNGGSRNSVDSGFDPDPVDPVPQQPAPRKKKKKRLWDIFR